MGRSARRDIRAGSEGDSRLSRVLLATGKPRWRPFASANGGRRCSDLPGGVAS